MIDMEELIQWSNQISSIEKLTIVEAQELYKKAISSTNDEQKKLYMNKLVLGTLYVVLNYIKSANLDLFISSSYDMNDIISSFNEVWIKKIYSGDLLKVNTFSLLFNTGFFNEVYNNLCGDELIINVQFGLTSNIIINLIYEYIKSKKSTVNTKFEDIIIKKYFETNKWNKEKKDIFDRVLAMIPILDKIYDSLNFDKLDDIEIGIYKVRHYLKFFINNGMIEKISNKYTDNGIEEQIIQNMMIDNFIEDIDMVITNPRSRQIIHEKYGLDGSEPKYIENIGKKYNIPNKQVRVILAKALRKLRSSDKFNIYKYGI